MFIYSVHSCFPDKISGSVMYV